MQVATSEQELQAALDLEDGLVAGHLPVPLGTRESKLPRRRPAAELAASLQRLLRCQSCKSTPACM